MAISNPGLIDGIDLNGTNQGTPATALVDDGYLFQSIPKSADMNRYFKELYRGMHFSKENGVWQYDAAVSYKKHARIMRDQNIYRSLSDGNQGNDPLSNPTFWQIDQWRMNTTTHNITADSDYTLTSEQNNFGKVIITDTGVVLTGAINIIMSDEEKDFIIQNNTAQILTVKTSGGTGITIGVGLKLWVLCDGTNIIDAITLNIASTAEAIAGTNDTKPITPLKLREGLNASGTAPVYATRAWVNFNGTGVVSITASGNVSSVGDNNTGDYTVNFTTALPDSDYVITSASSKQAAEGSPRQVVYEDGHTKTTSAVRLLTETDAGSNFDISNVMISFQR
ncbi:MAG: hypothetical protein ACTSPI_08710 [Candidatus Heimdallarchaeaceae archaeon]